MYALLDIDHRYDLIDDHNIVVVCPCAVVVVPAVSSDCYRSSRLYSLTTQTTQSGDGEELCRGWAIVVCGSSLVSCFAGHAPRATNCNGVRDEH